MSLQSLARATRPWWPGLPALAFLLVFFALPVSELLVHAFQAEPGRWGLGQFSRLAQEGVYAKVLRTTFLIALLTALISVALGYPLAYLLSQLTAGARTRWMTWLLIPFWTSYLVKTFAWILLLSRTGVVPSLAHALGAGESTLSLLPSLGGVLAGMVHALVPLAVMSMLPIMQGINTQLARAAQTLGAGRGSAFFTVFLPLSLPGAAAAGLLVFITSLGFFIVPALLGSPKETMIAQVVISVILELFNLPFAGALSVMLLLATVLVFVAYDRLVGMSSIAGDTAARRERSAGRVVMNALMALGRAADALLPAAGRGGALKAYGAVMVLLLMLPVAVVVPISFTASQFLAFPPEGFSLRWYETFLGSPVWQAALLRSLSVATATGVLAVALGLGAAFMLARLGGTWAKAVFSFVVAPLILPRIVIAVGLFYLFARLGLTGTEAGLVIGHTVLGIPYVVVTLAAALKRHDWRLDDAARLLGAGAFARLRTVTLPLLLPSLGAAFLFAFLTSFDELTIAIFVSGGLSTTLPKQMWDDMLLQVNPTLAAVSTSLLVAISLVVLTLGLLRRERAVAER
jgi:putative spermidine/putrescine transport system permease protein